MSDIINILIATNNYKGILEIERKKDSSFMGSITYFNLGKLQTLENFKYDENNGEISFSKGKQQ